MATPDSNFVDKYNSAYSPLARAYSATILPEITFILLNGI